MYLGPAAALTLVATARTRRQKTAAYSFAVCMLAVTLLSGERSRAFYPLLAGAVLWVKLGRRIPLVVAAGAIAAVLLVIPLIGMIRTLGTYEKLSFNDIQRAQQRSTMADALFEMGAIIGDLSVTLQHIPKEEPYRFGRPYLVALREAIPNIGFTLNTQYSRANLLQRLKSDPRTVLELDPSDWLSWKIMPERFLTMGSGFSGIADPYFSFGYAGVVVLFLLLGSFLARMDLVDVRLNYNWLVFAALYFWAVPLTCRNTFGAFTKPASLILTVLAIWVIVRQFTPFAKPVRRLPAQAATG
jgi:hypothetical protein